MKREEIKSIFPDATDEQLKAIMDLNGGEVEKNKKLEAELKGTKTQLESLNTEFETLKAANADSAEWKSKFEALQAENEEKAKKAEADRILKEKNDSVNRRFEAALGEKKFNHEAIQESYRKKFGEALESTDFEGKSDNEIFHELTKDDDKAFKGVEIVKLAGGRPTGAGNGKYTSRDEIFKIRDTETRQKEMLAHPDLFPEIQSN